VREADPAGVGLAYLHVGDAGRGDDVAGTLVVDQHQGALRVLQRVGDDGLDLVRGKITVQQDLSRGVRDPDLDLHADLHGFFA